MPELLVALGVLLVMTVGTLLMLRPKLYVAENLRAERRLELAAMAQALKRYKADAGQFPSEFPSQATLIGRGEEAYDLCSLLVPSYIKDIPLDPQIGFKYQEEVQQTEDGPACSEVGVDYAAGYTIAEAPNDGVTIAAPTKGKDALAITVR